MRYLPITAERGASGEGRAEYVSSDGNREQPEVPDAAHKRHCAGDTRDPCDRERGAAALSDHDGSVAHRPL